MEFPNSTLPGRKRSTVYATEARRDYISTLLDRLDASLEDYTDTFESDLTIGEASELIDTLQEEVGGHEDDE